MKWTPVFLLRCSRACILNAAISSIACRCLRPWREHVEATSFSRYVRLRLDNVVRGCVSFVFAWRCILYCGWFASLLSVVEVCVCRCALAVWLTLVDCADRETDLGNSVLQSTLPSSLSFAILRARVCVCVGSISIGPDIRQDYPLNLSILISGGKETN